MNYPKISVIIPIYNAEIYLRRCIDSVLAQTYRNLEIIVVDDGSSDTSGAICDEYTAKDNRVQIVHQKNGGVSAARNAGLNLATGDYIGFVDADDYIAPDMYEYLLGLIQKCDADIAQCGAFTEDGVSFAAKETYRTTHFSRSDWSLFYNNIWNKLYRREAAAKSTFPDGCSVGEDMLYNFGVLAVTQNVVFGEEPKYHYTEQAASVSHRVPTLKSLGDTHYAYKTARAMFSNDATASSYMNESFFLSCTDICSKIVRFYRPEFKPLKREIRETIKAERETIRSLTGLTHKDKMKLALAANCWQLYRFLLLMSKKLRS